MKKIIAVIPARSGSKGVADKNIKCLAGRPLIAYSIAAALLAKNIGRVIVSTDSENYANIARQYGAEVPFLRPTEISGDQSTDYDFIKHLIDWFQKNEGDSPDYLAHLRPTTPIRDPALIGSAITSFMLSDRATALRSVHKMSESAYKTFEKEGDYLKSVGSGCFELDTANNPRQKFRDTYCANGYIDVIRTAYVLENKKIHGGRVLAYITPRAVEVDTIDDFEYLEYWVERNPAFVNRLFK